MTGTHSLTRGEISHHRLAAITPPSSSQLGHWGAGAQGPRGRRRGPARSLVWAGQRVPARLQHTCCFRSSVATAASGRPSSPCVLAPQATRFPGRCTVGTAPGSPTPSVTRLTSTRSEDCRRSPPTPLTWPLSPPRGLAWPPHPPFLLECRQVSKTL